MDTIYRLLYAIGYEHPLHPAITHVPVGLVIGAFILGVLSLVLRREDMARAAKFCAVIALVSIFPTVLLGIMDWQHYFAGGWIYPIEIKIVLASLLLILLCIAVIFFRSGPLSVKAVIMCGLSFLISVGLGYFGGQLVYTGRVPPAPPGLEKGAYVFRANCSGCHPVGGNIVDRDAAIERSPELKDLATFTRFIRDPRLDSGKRGPMPVFTSSRIPENEARELWAYLSAVMGDVKHNEDEAQLPVEKIVVRTDPRNIQNGEKLLKENCSSCHAIASTETIIGPGLKGILRRQSLPVSGRPAVPENVYRQLKAPYKEMPSFSNKLSDDQMLDIIAYLNTLPP
jgi:mono/diheme cytochrome c family protein/uncharacterized membrane protein